MKNKKNFLVIGNPIKHSLSPLLHNYWFHKNKINCEYKKLKTLCWQRNLVRLIFQEPLLKQKQKK